ncbi:MAG: hypothetical protein ACFFG0_24315 [Candidatus Thorarchaeota archaeon]
MGKLTPKLLDLLNIKKYLINSLDDLEQIKKGVDFSKKSNESVGILLGKALWRDESEKI